MGNFIQALGRKDKDAAMVILMSQTAQFIEVSIRMEITTPLDFTGLIK